MTKIDFLHAFILYIKANEAFTMNHQVDPQSQERILNEAFSRPLGNSARTLIVLQLAKSPTEAV